MKRGPGAAGGRRGGTVLGLVLLLGLAGRAASGEERPPTSHLVLAGVAMVVPTYAVGVVAHEGSHALAARMMGAEVKTLRLLPGWHRGKFYFGYVEVRGLACERQRAAFLVAPKLTDAALLGAYALASFTGAYPSDRYGQLALTVLATGFWIDFSKDIVAFWDHNDTVKLYNLAGARSERARLPYRMLHAGLAAAGAVAIVRGYRQVFDSPGVGEVTVPLWLGSF